MSQDTHDEDVDFLAKMISGSKGEGDKDTERLDTERLDIMWTFFTRLVAVKAFKLLIRNDLMVRNGRMTEHDAAQAFLTSIKTELLARADAETAEIKKHLGTFEGQVIGSLFGQMLPNLAEVEARREKLIKLFDEKFAATILREIEDKKSK